MKLILWVSIILLLFGCAKKEESDDSDSSSSSSGYTRTSTPTAIVFGGATNVTNTESWDGTSWTEVSELNTGRRAQGGAGNKTQALCFAGSEPSSSAKNEFWNGSSWTEVNDLSTATDAVTGLGTGVSALSTGGTAGGGYSASTEEFTADNALATVTVS